MLRAIQIILDDGISIVFQSQGDTIRVTMKKKHVTIGCNVPKKAFDGAALLKIYENCKENMDREILCPPITKRIVL